MPVCSTVYEIFSVKEWRDLETGNKGRSRSLKMAPFDRSYTTLCALRRESHACCTVSSFACFHRLYLFFGCLTMPVV